VKFTLNVLEKNNGAQKRWPAYVFGGRMRTSTVVLVIAFFAVWWLYDTNRPEPAPPSGPPPTQVVPPGFVPDPDYTWVPRSRVQEPTYTAPKPTPTTTTPQTTTPPPPSTTTTTPPPPFQLPCIPPFCTPTTTPPTTTSPLPQPGPGPVPTSLAPAR
jgi:hypothetical protein